MSFCRQLSLMRLTILSGGLSAVCFANARKPQGFLYNTFSESASGKRRMYHTFPPECQTQF